MEKGTESIMQEMVVSTREVLTMKDNAMVTVSALTELVIFFKEIGRKEASMGIARSSTTRVTSMKESSNMGNKQVMER
jgi:hypothetical protein